MPVPGPYLELEEKLRPLAEPLPPPRPGDWLAEHDEPGQTFSEYLDARPVRKGDDRHTIYLCLVGDFSEAQRRILDLTQDYLALFFDCPVTVRRQIALGSIPTRHASGGPQRRPWPEAKHENEPPPHCSPRRQRHRPGRTSTLDVLQS
jgi:hypothetical protein